MYNNRHSKDLLTGAAVGGVVGAVAALLVAPKSGKKLRRNLYDMCCDITDKTHEIAEDVGKKGRSIAKSMGYSSSSSLTDKAREMLENAKEWVNPSTEEIGDNLRDMVIGSIVGAVIGFTAGLLLAPESGYELRQDIADKYHDISDKTQDRVASWRRKGKMYMAKRQVSSKVEDWLEFAQDVLSRLTGEKISAKAEDWMDVAQDVFHRFGGEAKEAGARAMRKGKEMTESNRVQDLMDWASLGLQVWHQLKKRG